MSMCTLGMAEEFKDEVACNSIWPMTPIWVRKKTAHRKLKKFQHTGLEPGSFRLISFFFILDGCYGNAAA